MAKVRNEPVRVSSPRVKSSAAEQQAQVDHEAPPPSLEVLNDGFEAKGKKKPAPKPAPQPRAATNQAKNAAKSAEGQEVQQPSPTPPPQQQEEIQPKPPPTPWTKAELVKQAPRSHKEKILLAAGVDKELLAKWSEEELTAAFAKVVDAADKPGPSKVKLSWTTTTVIPQSEGGDTIEKHEHSVELDLKVSEQREINGVALDAEKVQEAVTTANLLGPKVLMETVQSLGMNPAGQMSHEQIASAFAGVMLESQTPGAKELVVPHSYSYNTGGDGGQDVNQTDVHTLKFEVGAEGQITVGGKELPTGKQIQISKMLEQIPAERQRAELAGIGFDPKVLEEASEVDIHRALTEVSTQVSRPGGPGEFEVMLGKDEWKLYPQKTEDGQLAGFQIVKTVKKKKSFLKQIVGVVLTVLSVIPNPLTPIAIALNSVMSVYNGVKNKNWLGVVAGIAGGVASFAGGIAGSAAQTIAKGAQVVQKVANGIQAGMAAFKSKNPGAILGFFASAANEAAGFIGNAAGGAAEGLQTFAKWAGKGAQVANIITAAKNKDWGAVGGGALDLAGESGFISDQFKENGKLAIGAALAAKQKDWAAAGQLGLALAGNTGVVSKEVAENGQAILGTAQAIKNKDWDTVGAIGLEAAKEFGLLERTAEHNALVTEPPGTQESNLPEGESNLIGEPPVTEPLPALDRSLVEEPPGTPQTEAGEVDSDLIREPTTERLPAIDPSLVGEPDATNDDGPQLLNASRTVRKGETLSAIARDVYGDSKRWPEIYAYNLELVGGDPNKLKAGMELLLPPSDYEVSDQERQAIIRGAHLEPKPVGAPAASELEREIDDIRWDGSDGSDPHQDGGDIGLRARRDEIARVIEKEVPLGKPTPQMLALADDLKTMVRVAGIPKEAAEVVERAQAMLRKGDMTGFTKYFQDDRFVGVMANKLKLKDPRYLGAFAEMGKVLNVVSLGTTAIEAAGSDVHSTRAGQIANVVGQVAVDLLMGKANPAVQAFDTWMGRIDEKATLGKNIGGGVQSTIALFEALGSDDPAAALAKISARNAKGDNGWVIQGAHRVGEGLSMQINDKIDEYRYSYRQLVDTASFVGRAISKGIGGGK